MIADQIECSCRLELNKIYCMDCVDGIKQLDDYSIDLTLTDFPYGLNIDYGKFYIDTKDNLRKLVSRAMPEILRVSKRVLLTCGKSNLCLYPKPDWILAWINPAGASSNKWGFSCWQPILAYGGDPYLKNRMGRRPDIIYHNEKSENYKHPCPKPLGFWQKLLLRGSVHKNDIILDPFMGSGTTAYVCKQYHRNFIGFEINPEYVEVANKRLSKVQIAMFN